MNDFAPALYGQIEYFEKLLSSLKAKAAALPKKKSHATSFYGSLRGRSPSFIEFKAARKTLSSSWEKEWQ